MARLASVNSSQPSSYSSSSSSCTSYERFEVRTVKLTLVEAIQRVIDGSVGAAEFFLQAPPSLQLFLDDSSKAVFGCPFTGLSATPRGVLLQGLLEVVRCDDKKNARSKRRMWFFVGIALLPVAVGLVWTILWQLT
jgi:hypothetical protein